MNSDLCDVCGCRGAGGFRGDGLSTQQHPGVYVAVSVNLFRSKTPHFKITSYICARGKAKLLTELLSNIRQH